MAISESSQIKNPCYLNIKNVATITLCTIVVTVASAALGGLGVFLLHHFGSLQGIHVIIASVSIGGASLFFVFGELAVGGGISVYLFFRKEEPATISTAKRDFKLEPDVADGDAEKFKIDLNKMNSNAQRSYPYNPFDNEELKNFIKNNYNNPTAMDSLISQINTSTYSLFSPLFYMILHPINEDSVNNK